ncbi:MULTISPECIES: KdsC family phosphatase [Halanaerobium]|uniref:3-deoxy-D-manno-octulosonate 8-phosphate phosphatase (KDO 8-P phosphatase) n=1 Tax=Halanaerobium kushneri TaxID=56779 RepID=A0A1N7ACN5_9FIRM|nr:MULTISPECIES: HAD-IIIA family hydrolase [Halanaerobium]RCW54646.1 3-deoxy-D-manno-octulosonate 8-phosphate phosphatase (KDO 8-P phosphatase) [Halanaerobium sp. ST460_2HS_T2]SIR36741.1 3-deoxy-D-manno-octulosonate 8-phosphate phosphatase (KDO 8-P phosphatase) [Halanaerobium kushneri]
MKEINTIFLDVDGTLTNGKVYLDNGKNEFKAFNVKDGLMVVAAIKMGYDVIIMTGRKSEVVARRAAELGIEEYYQGVRDKKTALEKLMEKKGINYSNLAYLGDDLNDLAVMSKARFAGCPADAADEVKEISDLVSEFKGGAGAVREILTHLLKSKGEYHKIVESFS